MLNNTLHPTLLAIRERMIAAGHVLFEEYEVELSSFIGGLETSHELRRLNMEWASLNLRDIEYRVLNPGAEQRRPTERAPTESHKGIVSSYVRDHGTSDALQRRNRLLFELESKAHAAQSSSEVYLQPSPALALQKQVFRDSGYVVRKSQGYSFFEYGKKSDRTYPFTIFFTPFNLRRVVSRAQFNLCYRGSNDHEVIALTHNLFPCVFHYQLLNTDLVVEGRTKIAALIESRVRLHIRLLEMLMAHLETVRVS